MSEPAVAAEEEKAMVQGFGDPDPAVVQPHRRSAGRRDVAHDCRHTAPQPDRPARPSTARGLPGLSFVAAGLVAAALSPGAHCRQSMALLGQEGVIPFRR